MNYLALTTSTQLYFHVQGQRETSDSARSTFLMFNGATLPLQFWDGVADDLAQIGTVVRFDQRNAGATKASGTFTLLDAAADANALLEHLHLDNVIVVGHAWGGRAAQVFVRDFPHHVRAMCICGTGGQFPATVPADAVKNMRDAARAGDRAAWEHALEAVYCAKGYATRDPQGFRAVADLLWGNRPNPNVSWDARVAPSASYWGMARVPTLLIYGREDGNGTAQNADDLAARVPGAELIYVEQAGHFVVREQQSIVSAALQTFAKKLH